ncbi:MAG: FtsX-like permease family protein, partial [Nitrososphaerota archaeon]
MSNSVASEIRIGVEVYDPRTGERILGLPVSLGIQIGNSDVSVTTTPDGEGRISIDSQNITVLEPIYVRNVSIPGIWFLDRVVGQTERILSRTPQGYGYRRAAASGNLTVYEFYLSNYVGFSQQSDGSNLLLRLKLYMTKARIVQIYNPLSDLRKYDPRLSISVLSANFIEIGGSKAIVPINESLWLRLTITFQVESYGSIMFSSPRGDFSVSVETDNRTFIDLTPAVIRGLSSAETNILKALLDAIEPYGFKLDELYSKLLTISTLYEQSAREFENQNRENGTKSLISAIYTFRDVYNETSDTYTEAVGWTPTLIIILVFFSLALSRMITEKRLPANIIFVILFALMFCLFFFTQPNFRLYLDFVVSVFTLRMRIPFFSVILIQSLQAIAAVVLILIVCFTKLRDFAVQTFGVSMRNLRRRRMKTVLALVTIVLVSVATMSLLTFAPETTHRVPLLNRASKLDNAMVIYKRVVKEIPGLSYSEWNEPLQPYEVRDFQSGEWVKSMNIYGILAVNLRRDDGFEVDGFTRFSMVIVNPQFMEEYVNVTEIMSSDWSLNSTDRGMIIVGSEIALKYNLTEGSQVYLNNRRFTVKSVFNERNAVENLRDIDDEYFFSLPSSTSQVFDPSTKEIKGGSFIIGSVNDFALTEMSIYKVSIIAKDEYAEKIWDIAEGFLPSILDFWTEDAGTTRAQLIRTYEIHITSRGSVYLISSGLPTPTVAGDWQIHIIPVAITSLLLLTNALATVAERKSEIRTLFTSGASPTRIRLIFIIEGMTLGIIGGILGYVAGYGIAQVVGFALPSLVQKNL